MIKKKKPVSRTWTYIMDAHNKILAAERAALEQEKSDGADWFNAFQSVKNWLFERGKWDESHISDNPADTLINGLTAWEQREAQLVEALKYARRFLNSIDHDTAYIDAALKPPTGDAE